jgi:hypothetical protein
MANLAVLAGREIRESREGVRNGIRYEHAWMIIDRLLVPGKQGFDNVTESSGALRSVPKLLLALEEAATARPIGAVIETGYTMPGKLYVPQFGEAFSGLVHGHVALFRTEKDKSNDRPPEIVRFLTVSNPATGKLTHIRVTPKEGDNRFPTAPDEIQSMVRAAYLQTVAEFPLWQEVTVGPKGPNFMGITHVGQTREGPNIPEKASSGLTARMLADSLFGMFDNG